MLGEFSLVVHKQPHLFYINQKLVYIFIMWLLNKKIIKYFLILQYRLPTKQFVALRLI